MAGLRRELHAHDGGMPLVMIVADDRHHEASALVAILEDEGIETTTAVDGDAAVTSIEMRPPDLIVVDDDAAPIAKLAALLARLRYRFPNTVTVLMTSLCAWDPELQPALRHVEGLYLSKPIDVRALFELVVVSGARRARQERSLAPT